MTLINCLKSLLTNMKRKRLSDNMQTYDLVLTDANGRSVRAHRALLMDKSDYFARILDDHNLKELQLNENYLIELIHYLYAHDSDYSQPVDSSQLAVPPDTLYDNNQTTQRTDDHLYHREPTSSPLLESSSSTMDRSGSTITNSDIDILMRMLLLSKKYSFRQLYRSLMNEISYKLSPNTAVIVYKCAREFELTEFLDSTRMMILSWLPQLQSTEEFLSLKEDAIRHIFCAESPDIESECKLDALSAWWSSNKQANMTDLWVSFMMSN